MIPSRTAVGMRVSEFTCVDASDTAAQQSDCLFCVVIMILYVLYKDLYEQSVASSMKECHIVHPLHQHDSNILAAQVMCPLYSRWLLTKEFRVGSLARYGAEFNEASPVHLLTSNLSKSTTFPSRRQAFSHRGASIIQWPLHIAFMKDTVLAHWQITGSLLSELCFEV